MESSRECQTESCHMAHCSHENHRRIAHRGPLARKARWSAMPDSRSSLWAGSALGFAPASRHRWP
eukprot:3102595-Lingulodinium_polyedra.AAC.1